MSDTADLLRDAREVVRGGWCRHAFAKGDGDLPTQFCMTGALHQAAGSGWKKDEQHGGMWEFIPQYAEHERRKVGAAMMALSDATSEYVGSVYHSIPNFNDYKAKDVDEVVSVFDMAVEKAEEAAGA